MFRGKKSAQSANDKNEKKEQRAARQAERAARKAEQRAEQAAKKAARQKQRAARRQMVRDNRRIASLAGDMRWWIVGSIGLGWLITSLNVAQVVLIGQVIERVFQAASFPWLLLVLFLLILPARAAVAWWAPVLTARIDTRIRANLRNRLSTHIQRLGPALLNRERTGALVNTATAGVESVATFFSRHVPYLALGITIPLLVLAAIALMDWLTALVLLASQPLIPLALVGFNRLFGSAAERFWEASRTLSAQFLDGVQGLTTLKMFNYSRAYGNTLQAQSETLRWITMNRLFTNLFSLFFVEWITALGTITVAAGMAAWRLETGVISFGVAIIIVLLSVEVSRPLLSLWQTFQERTTELAAARHILALLDMPPDVTEAPRATAPESLTPGIRLDNVRFTYPAGHFAANGQHPALDGISFEVQPGETVALVGASGAGKTTVVNLLMRFYQPQEGDIVLGGHSLRDLPLGWLRRQMALVSQDSYLFTGSIADNLRLGRPDASDEEMEAAARAANIHDLIASLPEGYQTPIGERGADLSGGQAQRLALARAFLKEAPILLLDEATSQVDAESEQVIQRSLAERAADKTVLMVAHRLSTVRHADRILVLDRGTVAEAGTHDELLQHNGIYARLVETQRISATHTEDGHES
jgi:ABC-type multidrug transport system fused ATPase/permease subunit